MHDEIPILSEQFLFHWYFGKINSNKESFETILLQVSLYIRFEENSGHMQIHNCFKQSCIHLFFK